MSKEAAMRAMREARYRERAAGSGTGSKPAKRPVQAATPRRAESVAPVESADDLCGHRSMNGRTCTREKGHSAKNHRYS